MTVEQLCARFEALRSYPLLILGAVDTTLLRLLDNNAIVIPRRDVDLPAVQNALYKLQSEYNNWMERLLSAVISGQPIDTLLKIAWEVFDNPIFLEDMESRLLGEVDLASINEDEDRFLYQLCRKGYVDTEDFIRFSSLSEEAQLYCNPDLSPAFLDSPKTKFRMLVTYISSSGHRFAAFQIVESKKPLTAGHIAYARIFAGILQKYYNRANRLMDKHEYNGRIIAGLIDENYVSEQELGQFSDSLDWEKEDSLMVAAMAWADPQYGTPYTKQRLLFDFRVSFPEAEVYSEGQEFFLILNCSKGKSCEQHMEDIRALAELNRLQAGISQCFRDMHNFRKYYRQSLYALQKNMDGAQKTVAEYRDYIPAVLYEFLQTAQRQRGDIIPSSLERLDSLSDAAGNQYVDTLMTFILCGFNKSLAAERLNIHRNTLAYRLEKIESVLGKPLTPQDFSDADMLTYLLSCYLLTAQKGAEE